MNKKLALNTVIWFGLLTGLGAAVVYLNPQLMENWTGPALLASPPVAGILFFLLVRSSAKERPEQKVEEAEPCVCQGPPPAEIHEEAEPQQVETAAPRPEPAPEQVVPSGPPPEVTVVQILGLLQREGRLLDFLQEDIEPYDDAQIGAAVREVHRGCRAALKEVLGLSPVIDAEEGTVIEIDEDFDPSKIKLVGNVQGKPPFRGVLRHSGWRFTRINLPEWTGKDKTDVVAPAEVEVQ